MKSGADFNTKPSLSIESKPPFLSLSLFAFSFFFGSSLYNYSSCFIINWGGGGCQFNAATMQCGPSFQETSSAVADQKSTAKARLCREPIHTKVMSVFYSFYTVPSVINSE